VVGVRCRRLDPRKMDAGECQFTLLGAAADHPEWWLCGDDGGSRHYGVGMKMWWRVDLFLRYRVKTDNDVAFR
jgi:hypothetical protein